MYVLVLLFLMHHLPHLCVLIVEKTDMYANAFTCNPLIALRFFNRDFLSCLLNVCVLCIHHNHNLTRVSRHYFYTF